MQRAGEETGLVMEKLTYEGLAARHREGDMARLASHRPEACREDTEGPLVRIPSTVRSGSSEACRAEFLGLEDFSIWISNVLTIKGY